MSSIITQNHARVIAALVRLDAVEHGEHGRLLGDVAQEAGMGMERARKLLHELAHRTEVLGGGRQPFVYTTEPRARKPRRYYLRHRLDELIEPGEQRSLGL